MSNEKFLKEIKVIVGYGDKNTRKVVRLLVSKMGFVQEETTSHYHLSHPRLGNYKATLSCSPSREWGPKFVSNIRHALWKQEGKI